MKKVVLTLDADQEIRDLAQARLAGLAEVSYLADAAPEERADLIKSADVVSFYMLGKEMTEEELPLLESASMLQSIPAGVEWLPWDKLPTEILLCANSGAWAAPLAEYVLGMMIALDKEFLTERKKLAEGVWDRRYMKWFPGRTFGVVGFGGIGRSSAELVRHLGMKIMALTSRGKTEAEVDFVGTLDDLEKVLTESDVVLISIPLKHNTRGLIGARELGWMKDDAVLINVARGPIIDEAALYEHLKSHPDFKFGADVWWREGDNYSQNHPIFDLPNVLGTPHNADHQECMLGVAADQAFQNIADYLSGRPLRGVVDRKDYA